MDKLLNPPNIDLTEAELRFGFVNAKSKTYILLELPTQRSGKYIAKAMEADCSANSNPATAFLAWDCMDDFDAGKGPSQILTKIH